MWNCIWFSCGLMRKTTQIPGWRPRSHCFLHRIINLPNLTAVSKMPCPRFLAFLGTSLGNPSGMTRVKTRRKERGHFGNLQKREGDKEARPTQQWLWMDKERVWMTTQSLRPLRAPNIHIPLPPQSGGQKPGCLRGAHSVGVLKDQRIQVWKKRTSYWFRSWYRIGCFLFCLTLWSFFLKKFP